MSSGEGQLACEQTMFGVREFQRNKWVKQPQKNDARWLEQPMKKLCTWVRQPSIEDLCVGVRQLQLEDNSQWMDVIYGG